MSEKLAALEQCLASLEENNDYEDAAHMFHADFVDSEALGVGNLTLAEAETIDKAHARVTNSLTSYGKAVRRVRLSVSHRVAELRAAEEKKSAATARRPPVGGKKDASRPERRLRIREEE